jgi:hypothetical protein
LRNRFPSDVKKSAVNASRCAGDSFVIVFFIIPSKKADPVSAFLQLHTKFILPLDIPPAISYNHSIGQRNICS